MRLCWLLSLSLSFVSTYLYVIVQIHVTLFLTLAVNISFFSLQYLGLVEVEESRGMHVCEEAVKKLKVVSIPHTDTQLHTASLLQNWRFILLYGGS